MSGIYPDKLSVSSVEVLDEQSRLADLLKSLGSLKKIRISPPIDLSTTSMISAQEAKLGRIAGENSEVKISGLEKGKLIAVRSAGGINKEWHTTHFLQLKNDSRLMTEIPLTDTAMALGWTGNEVVVYPDDNKFRTVRIEETPAGFKKIDFSDTGHDPSYTKDGDEKCIIRGLDDTEFFMLDQNIANKASQLAEKFKK